MRVADLQALNYRMQMTLIFMIKDDFIRVNHKNQCPTRSFVFLFSNILS